MDYEDFVIEIGLNGDHGYIVRVLKSPAGTGESSFICPWITSETRSLLEHLGRHVCTHESLPLVSSESPTEVGAQLFDALFTGQVRSLYDQSIGTLNKREQGLRITLKLNPRHPELARICSLPWELLFRRETEDFLSFSRHTPLVRALDVLRSPRSRALPSPLRILVVMSEPQDLPQIALDQEQRNLRRAFLRRQDIELTFLDQARLGRLRNSLLGRAFHVVHFVGHGGFDPETGEGGLYLEQSDGASLMVSGHNFANKIKDFKSIQLVLLNACDTARLVSDDGTNPFAGVASSLVLAGIPSVIAMQFPISDKAALAFSKAFYERLAEGDHADAAVAEGRQAIDSVLPRTTEWATPVLFIRASGENSSHVPRVIPLLESSQSNVSPSLKPRRLGALTLFTLALAIVAFIYWHRDSEGRAIAQRHQNVVFEFIIENDQNHRLLRQHTTPDLVEIDLIRRETSTIFATLQIDRPHVSTSLELPRGEYFLRTQRPDISLEPDTIDVSGVRTTQTSRTIAIKVLGTSILLLVPQEFDQVITLWAKGIAQLVERRSPTLAVVESIPPGTYRLQSPESRLYRGLTQDITVVQNAGPYMLSFLAKRKPTPLPLPRPKPRSERQADIRPSKSATTPGRSRANYLMLIRSVQNACTGEEQSLGPVLELLRKNEHGDGRLPLLHEEKQKISVVLDKLESARCDGFHKWLPKTN